MWFLLLSLSLFVSSFSLESSLHYSPAKKEQKDIMINTMPDNENMYTNFNIVYLNTKVNEKHK